MKILAALIFIYFSVFPISSTNEKIAWDENQRLTWSDFKGTPESIGDFVASTNSGMSFSYSYKISNGETDVKYSVTSNFYPNLSWYQPDRVTPYILKHEQTHFDISEVHARILRKRISEVLFSTNVKAEIEKLYTEVEADRRQMQADFDEETDHSKIRSYEEQWETFVAKQLEKYEAWK